MTPYPLLLVGLLLIFLEFYLPGAVLGILGGICLLASIILFTYQSTSPLAVAFYLIATGISLGLLIKFALWKIRHTKSRFNIYSDNAQNGFIASKYDPTAIGKIGIVVTDLKPGGYIQIEGKQHQALSKSGYIVKGTDVIVVGGQEETLIVQTRTKESKT